MWQHPVISTAGFSNCVFILFLTSFFDTKKHSIYTQNEPLNLLPGKNLLSCVQVALQSQAGAMGPP